MALSAISSAESNTSIPLSALQEVILSSKSWSTSATTSSSPHPPHLLHLALQIQHNLQHQHDWTSLQIHISSPLTQRPLPRPLISGLPPKRLYIHPDEQIALLKHQHESGKAVGGEGVEPEREWVLPTHLQEKWSLKGLAEVFDGVGAVPPSEVGEDGEQGEEDGKEVGWEWRGSRRQKRILLGTLHDDSTVVYYIVHDGIVKPRQN